MDYWTKLKKLKTYCNCALDFMYNGKTKTAGKIGWKPKHVRHQRDGGGGGVGHDYLNAYQSFPFQKMIYLLHRMRLIVAT